jgi:ABC-type transport system substrate-binding protein
VRPETAYDPAGGQVLSVLCEPLLQNDPLTGELRAGLVSYWITTSKGAQLTLRLRRGAPFHKGGTLDASDVTRSLSTVAALETASYSAELLEQVKGYEALHGLSSTDEASELKELRGVTALSDSSLAISLSTRNASFVESLVHPATAPQSRDVAASANADPACVGPYRLQEPVTDASTRITAVRAKEYPGDNEAYTNGGRGYVDRIEFRVFSSRRAGVAAFQKGDVDLAAVPDDLLSEPVPAGASRVSAPNGFVEYVGFGALDPEESPYGRPEVRRALGQVLDRPLLSRVAYGGGALPAKRLLPPTTGDASGVDACPSSDADDAAGVVAASGAQSKPLKLYFNDEFGNRALAGEIARQWRAAVGIRVQAVPLTWTAYLERANSTAGFDGAFMQSWQGRVPSADAYLAPLLSSATVGTSNMAHHIDTAFERALRDARSATDDNARKLAYQKVERRACETMPLVPLVYRQWHYLVRDSALGTANGSWTLAASGLLDLREIHRR